MEYIKKHGVAAGIIVVVVLLGGLFIYNNHQVGEAQKKEDQAQAEQEKKAAEAKKVEAEKKAEAEKAKTQDYSYTTVDGDNYTYLARRAVQAYAAANGVTLEKSQVIAAETKLAEQAEWMAVDVDQTVTLASADLKKVVDEVKAFTAEQKAAWDIYSPYVQL